MEIYAVKMPQDKPATQSLSWPETFFPMNTVSVSFFCVFGFAKYFCTAAPLSLGHSTKLQIGLRA